MAHTHQWWQTGVIYQIYPRSFLDSNGDGVGDLPGIASKLDYLRWLGVDAIWLSPIYPSPMADFGYDITNYTDVHPLFGTLQDLDILLEQTHQRDLKVILDFVPNHTSDEHPWFQETQSSRTNEKRDLRGTPTCYYGDELGIQNVPLPLELLHDPQRKENPAYSRDPQRTPMQWDGSPNASFCPPSVRPWLPVASDYQTYNVTAEQHDPRSFLTFVHTLLTLRRALPALAVGSQQSFDQPNPACFVYQRQYADQRCLVALNFSAQDQIVTLPEQGQGRVLLSTHVDREGLIPLSEVHLRGNEGLLLEVEASSLPGE